MLGMSHTVCHIYGNVWLRYIQNSQAWYLGTATHPCSVRGGNKGQPIGVQPQQRDCSGSVGFHEWSWKISPKETMLHLQGIVKFHHCRFGYGPVWLKNGVPVVVSTNPCIRAIPISLFNCRAPLCQGSSKPRPSQYSRYCASSLGKPLPLALAATQFGDGESPSSRNRRVCVITTK